MGNIFCSCSKDEDKQLAMTAETEEVVEDVSTEAPAALKEVEVAVVKAMDAVAGAAANAEAATETVADVAVPTVDTTVLSMNAAAGNIVVAGDKVDMAATAVGEERQLQNPANKRSDGSSKVKSPSAASKSRLSIYRITKTQLSNRLKMVTKSKVLRMSLSSFKSKNKNKLPKEKQVVAASG